MFKKSIRTVSFFLSLAAMSASAHAGQTILSYWPNQTAAVVDRTASSRAELNSAFASSRIAPRFHAPKSLDRGGNASR